MIYTIGIIILLATTLISILMMMGNVIAKSRYGKTWALVSGLSMIVALALFIMKTFVPIPLEKSAATNVTIKANTVTTDNSSQPQHVSTSDNQQTPDTSAKQSPNGTVSDANAQNLSYLIPVYQALKNGQPVPEQYRSMLPQSN